MLFSRDCPTCHEAIRDYTHIFRERPIGPGTARVAWIEVPRGTDETTTTALPSFPSHEVGHLTDAIEWFTSTPVGIVLDAGVTESVTHDVLSLLSGVSSEGHAAKNSGRDRVVAKTLAGAECASLPYTRTTTSSARKQSQSSQPAPLLAIERGVLFGRNGTPLEPVNEVSFVGMLW